MWNKKGYRYRYRDIHITSRHYFPSLKEFCSHSNLFYNDLKIEELQKKELQLLKMKEDVNKTHKNINKMEQLKQQFEAQNLSMQSVEMDNLDLTKKLHKCLEEKRIIAKERDELRRIKESLKMERDQFRETLTEMIASVSPESSLI